jgi:PKD repeat protein
MRFFLTIFITLCVNYLVAQSCPATFSTITISCNEIRFIPDSDNANSYTWDFGDGETSTQREPEHIFFVDNSGSASFNVTLITGGGCVADTVTQRVTVNVGSLPDPSIQSEGIFEFTNCAPTDDPSYELIINNTSTTTSSNNLYVIDWGDGSPEYRAATLPNGTSHVYASVGLYQIVVSIRGQNGCWARRSFPFFYGSNPGGNIVPVSNQIACVPGPVEFTIEGTDNNSPGTIYRIWVNDGLGDTAVFNHPPPQTYTYNLTTSPCLDADTLNNAYQIFFEAINPCFTQTGGTIIRANLAPEVNFEILPEEACENETFTITNLSTPAQYAQGNECSSEMITEWSINPANPDNYTITSGSLNDESGFTIEFSEDGEYTITLNYIPRFSNACLSPPLSRTVCVKPIPDSEISPNRTEGCTSDNNQLTVSFTNESNTLDACSPEAEYLWSVGYDPGDCGTTPGWVQLRTNPTESPSLTDQDIRLRFDSAGIYTVYLQVTNDCGVDLDSTIITVAGAPLLTVTEVADSCFVGPYELFPSLDFSSDCFDNPTFRWSFPGGTPDEHTGEFPPVIRYNQAGEYTIEVEVENSCGTTTARETFELFPPPPLPNIEVTPEVCVGGTISATNPPPPEPNIVSYSWVGPGGFLSNEATWTITNATVDNDGIYTLTIIDENGCVNTVDYDVTVTLNAPIVISPEAPTVCINEDLELTASGGIVYTWTGEHLNTNEGSSVIFNSDEIGEFQIIVEGSDPNGQCDGADTIIVTVVPLPVVDAGEERLGCVGQSFDFQPGASPAIIPGTSGTWSGDHISPAGIFNVDTPGEYTVTYTYTDENGCQNSDDATICIRDIPDAEFTLPEDFGCVATGGLILRPENISNTFDDCDPSSYTWSITYNGSECNSSAGPVNFLEGTDAMSPSPVIELTESGEYTIELTVTSDCGDDITMREVTVGDVPQATIDPVDNRCGPQDVTFSASVAACNAGPVNYAWSFPGGTPATSTEASPTVNFPVGNFTVSLVVSNTCGNTEMLTEDFRVLEASTIDLTLPQDTVCTGTRFDAVNNSMGSDLTYLWSASDAAITIINPTDGDPTFDFTGVDLGTYTISVTINNGVCGEENRDFAIFINEAPEVTLSPIDNGCGEVEINPTTTLGIPAENIETYQWQLVLGTDTTLLATTADPGTISVDSAGDYTLVFTAANACGTSTTSQPFRVLDGPMLDVSLSTDTLCSGGQLTVTGNSSGTDIVYSWSADHPNITFTPGDSETPTINFTNVPFGAYTITLTATNNLCPDQSLNFPVYVREAPVVTLENPGTFCAPASFPPNFGLDIPEADVTSFNWQLVFGTDTTSLAATLDPGSVSVVIPGNYELIFSAANECGSDREIVDFRVLEGPRPAFDMTSAELCLNGNNTVTLTNQSGGDVENIDWEVSGPSPSNTVVQSASGFNPTFTLDPNTTLGEYTITASLSNSVCSPPVTWDTTIFILDVPVLNISPIDNDCAQTEISPVVTYGIDVSLIDTIIWRLERTAGADAGAVIYAGGPRNTPINVVGPGTYTFSVTAVNRCTPDSVRASTSFDLLESPTGTYAPLPDFVCRGSGSVTMESMFSGDIDDYNWTVTHLPSMQEITALSSTDENPTFTFTSDLALGEYEIAVELSNAECPNIPWRDTIRLNATPIGITIDPIDDRCDTIAFTPTADFGEFDALLVQNYLWTFPPGSSPATSDQRNPGLVTLGTTGNNLEVSLEVTTECGTETFTTDFNLFVGPQVDVSISDNFACIGDVLTIENSSNGSNLEYRWTASPSSGVVFSDDEAAAPTITLNGPVGEYTITVEIGNDLCEFLTWETQVTVSDAPVLNMPPLPDGCGIANYLPVVDYGLEDRFVDSVRWTLVGISGANAGVTIYSDTLRRLTDSIPVVGSGVYEFTATAYNGCATAGVTVTESFRIFESPLPGFFLDTTFVCQGETITAIDTSSGDITTRRWSVVNSTGAEVLSSTDSIATFTFEDNLPVGDYTIILTVSNPECGNISVQQIVRLSAPPVLMMDPLPDGCGLANYLPVVDYGLEDRFVDSVRWTIVGISGANAGVTIYSDTLRRLTDSIAVVGAGVYEFTATAYNGCATAGVTVTESFRIFESPLPGFFLDTTFVCQGETITAIDTSSGDITTRRWSVVNSTGAEVLSSTDSIATFTFEDNLPVGDYTIILTVSNPECGNISVQQIVRLSAPPVLMMDPLPDGCGLANYLPVVDYGLEDRFVDSVRWTLVGISGANAGVTIYSDTLRRLTDSIPVVGAGVYEFTATAYNGCATAGVTVTESFRIFESPLPGFFLDTTFVCQGETITAIDTSSGDITTRRWSVVNSTGAEVLSSTDSIATFTFEDNLPVGDYTIILTVSNPECGNISVQQIVRLSAPPVLMMDPLPDGCGLANYLPVVDYGLEDRFVDSVRWTIVGISGTNAGVTIYSDTLRRLTDSIAVVGAGVYEFTATAYNGCAICGVTVIATSFRLFESPLPGFFLDTTFVCRGRDHHRH